MNAEASRRHGVRLRPCTVGSCLLALLLQGCQIADPQVTIIPAAEEARRAASEAVIRPAPSIPDRIPVTQPGQAGEQIDARTQRLAQREDLRLPRSEAGYYMDVQEAQLRQDLQDRQVTIERDAESIIIRISGDSTFGTSSSEPGARLRELLATISGVLNQFRKTLVIVNSHTDDRGDADFNQRLSEERARAVARFLAERGLPMDRVVAIGHGESNPLATLSVNGEAWPDRRIEIRLQLILEQTS